MMRFTSSALRLSLRHRLFGIGLMCAAGAAGAQAVPPVDVSANPPMPTAHSVGTVPAPDGRPPVVGATARHLLEAQASGRAAAPGQPVYGATASLSWKRYVDTFSHPIPEFLESRVGKKSSQ